MKFKLYLPVILLLVLLANCGNPPEYPDEPKIEFVSVSKNLIDDEDSLQIVIQFEDGDGDLGGESTFNCDGCDTSCLSDEPWTVLLTDLRRGCGTIYSLPEFPAGGNTDDIAGKIVIYHNPRCYPLDSLFGGVEPDFDTISYSIQIQDRKGNLSNVVTTPVAVVIDCLP